MRLGDVANESALPHGKPLEGVRVLSMELLQALPFCTQLLGRLGADVVKIERPGGGDVGRQLLPTMADPDGRPVGNTFLRNNLCKRSIVVDVKSPEGRDLVLRMLPNFDVFAENLRPGAAENLGLGWEEVHQAAPRTVYLSISGFGASDASPYRTWPAYADIAEAMTGIYEMKRVPGRPPVTVPMGGVGDIGSALFSAVGILSALRQRERTGRGQFIDVAMMDVMVAVTDIVTNLWSMGMPEGRIGPQFMHGFEAADGWFVIHVNFENEFARMADVVGHPEWLTDERLSTRPGWNEHLDAVIRPGIEGWAAGRTRAQACAELAAQGVAAAPCLRAPEVAADPHVAARDMLVEIERTDGVAQPVLVPGNPLKMSDVAVGPDRRIPWLGEHTDEVLAAELGLTASELAGLRAAGTIGS
jgi:formyl-CoA transferase